MDHIVVVVVSMIFIVLFRFKFEAVLWMSISSLLTHLFLHILGVALGEPYITSKKKLYDIGLISIVPMLNGVMASMIIVFILMSPTPKSIKRLIKNLN